MIITMYECDKCKRRLEDKTKMMKPFGMVDLCSECFEKAVDNFNSWLSADEKPKKRTRKEIKAPEPQIEKPIDWDKACALKVAGWSNKKIADEMGLNEITMNSGTFYTKLKRYKEGARDGKREIFEDL